MRIAVLCATHRGLRFLKKLAALAPQHELLVFSFREEPWEPPFLDDIRAFSEEHGAGFFETRNVASSRWQSIWEQPVDLMFAVSWRYMIPADIYRLPRLGAFVFHDSLLPEYRGFSPTVWAMINGEDHTGVTLFEIAEEVDSGRIVAQERVPIGPDERIAAVLERVTEAYLRLLEQNLDALLVGSAPLREQDHSRASFTCKRLPEDNRIDWQAPTRQVYNLIRAVTAPYPGAYTECEGQRLRVWDAEPFPAPPYAGRIPGRIIQVLPGSGTVVLTGDGALLVKQVQIDGGEIEPADKVLKSLNQTLR